MLDKDEYELYFLIGSHNIKRQSYTLYNGKMKDDSVIFKYDEKLKAEIEKFDDLGKVQIPVIIMPYCMALTDMRHIS